MIGGRLVLLACVIAGLAAPVSGQSRSVDAERLPLDLDRMRQQLQSDTSEERDGLNLSYFVRIYALSPPIPLFAPGENITTGPVPYGAPTHQEFIDFRTPQQFRSPVMDFRAVQQWLTDWLSRRRAKPAE